MRIGFRVFRTCSKMPRHLALNSEMATSFIESDCTMVNDHGQSWFLSSTAFSRAVRSTLQSLLLVPLLHRHFCSELPSLLTSA
jgi:hypothetical protein